ncbi:MAG: hypothetical protein WCV79_01540 [Candidatus Paceibacterota bacterium]
MSAKANRISTELYKTRSGKYKLKNLKTGTENEMDADGLASAIR